MAPKARSENENPEKAFFLQAAIKGYETEIENLKKQVEHLQETTQVRKKILLNIIKKVLIF